MDYVQRQKRNLIITIAITLAVCTAIIGGFAIYAKACEKHERKGRWHGYPDDVKITIEAEGTTENALTVTMSELPEKLGDDKKQRLCFTAQNPDEIEFSIGIKFDGKTVLKSEKPPLIAGRALVRDYGRRWTAYDGDRKYVRAIFRLYDDKDADSTEYTHEFEVFVYEAEA